MQHIPGEFLQKAISLGHDVRALSAGDEIISYLHIPTIEEAGQILCTAATAQRKIRQQQFFNPSIAARQRLGQGMHDRVEAIIYADGMPLDQNDTEGLNRHLPVRLKAISVLQKTIPAGETWDISVRGEQWDVGHMEDLFVIVNIGELILEPGASIIVRGNLFSLICQRLVCKAVAGDGYHIGILPTPFSADMRVKPRAGNGEHGQHGNDGANGRMVVPAHSMLGYYLVDDIHETELHGAAGTDGTPGTRGSDGRNGGACKIADIAIRELQGHCVVFAQAGKGSNGYAGGYGGNGGNGGNGTDGHQLISGILPSGNGGHGGNGANGGNGGHAGSGGLASNIYINVPAQNEQQVTCIAMPSVGGSGGKGGRAGNAGKAGRGGRGAVNGVDGKDGIDGKPGKHGNNGRSRPAPVIFINEGRK